MKTCIKYTGLSLKYTGLILLAVLAGVILLASAGKIKLPIKKMKDLVDAEAKAKKLEARIGRDEAVKQIKEEHEDVLKALDEQERAEVERLSDDPSSLSKALLRAGRKASKPRV